jgi:hypothetical protein
MLQSTTLLAETMKMKTKVYFRRLHELCDELIGHPNRDEIISLMMEQLADDTDTIETAYAYTS